MSVLDRATYYALAVVAYSCGVLAIAVEWAGLLGDEETELDVLDPERF
jgi:hypothetical protein